MPERCVDRPLPSRGRLLRLFALLGSPRSDECAAAAQFTLLPPPLLEEGVEIGYPSAAGS